MASRLDKWLWHARFYKTRTLATAAINGGKVHLNAERVKPAHRVRIGDGSACRCEGIVAEFESARDCPRGAVPPPKRKRIISRRRRAQRAARNCASSSGSRSSRGPRPDARPDKRDRRRLMRLQRDQT